MPKLSAVPRRNRLKQILTIGRHHWDHDGYDPNARRVFRLALQCKTPALGRRVYASENERREFCNTCKSAVACTSCGHWATSQWQRQRECALPDGRYLSITFTMPDTLWSLFAANTRLCRRLAEIAAGVIGNYARVRRGAEVGVMPVLQTFNGKLEFNPHVHTLVTTWDLRTAGPQGASSIFFDRYELRDSWQRLVIALLRGALEAGQLKPGMARDEVERLLQKEEKRAWYPTHVRADEKGHFLSYGGRYARRPPFAERRVLGIVNGRVGFWYMDKKTHRRETLWCTVEEFIDRWAQHISQRYHHAVRYFGLFAPRCWAEIGTAVFTIRGAKRRPRPKRLPWVVAVQQLGGPNPLVDYKGQPMKFVRHLAPVAS
jgi:hypothetical protein